MDAKTQDIETGKAVALLDDPQDRLAQPFSAGGERVTAQHIRDLIVALAEAAEDVRLAACVLTREAEAVRLAIEAIKRIEETSDATLRQMMAIHADHTERLAGTGSPARDEISLSTRNLERLTRPLALASAAAVAVNASITSSSMALTEASLRVVRAGERFVDVSRLPGSRR
jgi:hypothetical protein